MTQRLFSIASAMCTVAVRCTGLGLVVLALGSAAQGGILSPAPEIDAGSLVSGLTLLAGGILVVTNRIRRK
jgi:hypothetical protein